MVSNGKQGRSQDVSLRGSVCERSEPATRGRLWVSEASPLRLPQFGNKDQFCTLLPEYLQFCCFEGNTS